MSDLRGVPLILFSEGFALNPIILDACKKHGFEPEIATRSSQIDFILELVASGLGVGFLPRMVALQREHEDVRHLSINDSDMFWHIAFVWRRSAYLSDAAQAWLDLVRYGDQRVSKE